VEVEAAVVMEEGEGEGEGELVDNLLKFLCGYNEQVFVL
jgi:hypothetical protein